MNDAALANSLKRLWPNREHESNWFMQLFCRLGFHYWSELNLATVMPKREVRFCFWCPALKIDGVIYPD